MCGEEAVLAARARNDAVVFAVIASEPIAQVAKFALALRPVDLLLRFRMAAFAARYAMR